MAVAILDTNVLFASASSRDEYHAPGREIVRAIDHGELPEVVVTNYIVAETLNLTRERLGSDTATGLLDRLLEAAHFEIVSAPQTDFTAAQAIFRQYPTLSFVDATIVAYMQREGIEYLYSFDPDFDRVTEISRLATPTDPFQ